MAFAARVGSTPRLATKTALVGLALVALACKKDPTSPTLVAAGNTTVAVNATVATAIVGTPFVFTGGAGALHASVAGQNLTVTFGGTTTRTATLVVGTTNVTANVTFGSCIFTITASGFTAPHALAVGQTVTVSSCSLDINTQGLSASGTPTSRGVTFILGGVRSASASATITVGADGTVTVNGTTVGTTTVTPSTGT